MQRLLWSLALNAATVAMLAGAAEARRTVVAVPLPGSTVGNVFWAGVGAAAVIGIVFKRVLKRNGRKSGDDGQAAHQSVAPAAEHQALPPRTRPAVTRTGGRAASPARTGFGRRG